MKRDEERKRDWQEEVWRVKAELAAEARRMGMREYVTFVEKEADRILESRTNPSLFLARDRPATKSRRPRARKP
jgi:predicted secreted hydrolase